MKDQIDSFDKNNPGFADRQKDIIQWEKDGKPGEKHQQMPLIPKEKNKNKQQAKFKTKKMRHAGKK